MAKDNIVTAHHKIDWTVINHEVARKYQDAAKYYIDADVVGLIQRDDGLRSVQALIEAGICRLPYNPMMVEFQATDKFRWFILLEEQPEDSKFDFLCQCIFMHLPTRKTYYSSKDAELFMTDEGFIVNNVATQQDAHAAICAVTMSLLLLNTTGIEKEVVCPEKLNAIRHKKGEPAIPRVTTLRIGTVYDREGKAHSIGTGGMRRVHLRAGHTRRQHYGKGNAEIKIVYIPPVLVNYNPELGEKPKLPEKKVVL
jgi:hypothetical protein